MIVNEKVTLSEGSRGAEVGNWQRFLNRLQYRDADDHPLVVDEAFGRRTSDATRAYQRASGIFVNGCLDAETRRLAGHLGFVPFVAAKYQGVYWPRRRRITRIVIHTMECQEADLDAAENVALWFAGKTPYKPPVASAHYCIDRNSIVQCVRDTDEAWHANEVNGHSLGFEHAGRAKQSEAEWDDEISRAILERSAKLAADKCREYAIPLVRLTPTEVRTTARPGFLGHVDVSTAYNHPGGHWDPGPSFPWERYLALVQEHM